MILKILCLIFILMHEIACEVKYKNNCCLTKDELKGTWIASYLANDDDTCFANGGSWVHIKFYDFWVFVILLIIQIYNLYLS